MVGMFGTRELRRGVGAARASANPFAAFSGLSTLECLADELPAEIQLAILRQSLVRRMCIQCLLQGKEPMAARFANEISAAIT